MQEMYVRSRLKSAMVLILKREQIDITITGSDNTTQRLKGTLKKPLNFFYDFLLLLCCIRTYLIRLNSRLLKH